MHPRNPASGFLLLFLFTPSDAFVVQTSLVTSPAVLIRKAACVRGNCGRASSWSRNPHHATAGQQSADSAEGKEEGRAGVEENPRFTVDPTDQGCLLGAATTNEEAQQRMLVSISGTRDSGTRKRPGISGLSLARLACCALLPALSLAGFGTAAAAAGARARAGAAGGAAVMSPLLTNHWYMWAVLMASSSAGLWSECTRWGAAVSSPLVTMLLTITLCNIGALPAASPVYNTVNQVFVPLAVPLLLFDADLQKVLRFSGTLLVCFVIGAAGTVIGTVAAAAAVPLGLGTDGWKIASALAARHIGGAVNYVAVCETLGVSADAVVAGLAADNMVVSLYFIFLFWVTKPQKEEQASTTVAAAAKGPVKPSAEADATRASSLSTPAAAAVTATTTAAPPLAVTKDTISYALTAACALCLCGEWLSKAAFGGRVSSIPLVTLATVAGATIAPSFVGRLGHVGAQLGVLLMQLFFAVTGAQGSLAVVVGTAPSLLVFSLVQIAVHFGILVGVGRLFRLPFRELALASNANVGGPTTAAAMAAAKGWKHLVLPALLTGVLGYATATFIGVGIGHALLKALIGGATL